MEFFILALKSVAFIIIIVMLFQHFSWLMLAIVLVLAALIAKDILVIVSKRSRSNTESCNQTTELRKIFRSYDGKIWILNHYYHLRCDDEVEILKWLQQQGFCFKGVYGREDHDIGEQEYFYGSINTNDIDEITSFLKKVDSWTADAVYKGIEVGLHGTTPILELTFDISKEAEDIFAPVFRTFQEVFCYQNLMIREIIQIDEASVSSAPVFDSKSNTESSNRPETKNREHTELRIYRHEDRITRLYYDLKCNDQVRIIKWLHQQGFCFEMLSGEEDHDIGDQDYFAGIVRTNDIDEISGFLDKLYGSWNSDAVYKGIQVRLDKQYPNIYHGLSFVFPREAEELLAPVFRGFEEEFCYQDIMIDERVEINSVMFKVNT